MTKLVEEEKVLPEPDAWEIEGLKKVLTLLKSNKLVHEKYIYDAAIEDECVFNMDIAGSSTACGSAACIGGWNYILTNELDPASLKWQDLNNVRGYVQNNRHSTITDLYFPCVRDGEEWRDVKYNSITTQQAIVAIENYLEYRDPRWIEILTPDQLD